MASFGKIAQYTALAMEIPFAPIGAGLVGYMIDKYFGTGPLWTLILGLLGVVQAGLTLVRLARELRPRD